MCCLMWALTGCSRDNDIVIPQASVDRVNINSVTVGDEMVFTGTNMHLITKMTFGTVEAEMNVNLGSRDRNMLKVIVPALEATANVQLTATYNTNKKLVICQELEVIVPPVIPTVSTQLSGEVMSGDVVELQGANLQIIKSIKVNSQAVDIRTKNATGLSFIAPEVTTSTAATVILVYDNSLGADQTLTISGQLTIKPVPVAKVYEWNDVIIGGQATEFSFFDGTTGQAYSACALFANQSNIDFLMNVSSAGENQFYDPSNTGNVLKNQKCDGKALGTADGKDYSVFQDTSTKFLILSATDEVQAALINKVKNKEITEFTEALFDGITAPASRTPKNFEVGDVVWYYNATKQKNGLIEIKGVTAGTTVQENTIKMHVYFEK